MTDCYSIGVDLGGTNLRVAAYSGGTTFLESVKLPTRVGSGPEAVVQDICGAVRSLQQRIAAGVQLEFTGVGIGSPGPLELPAGIIRNPPNLPGWDGFPLLESLRTALGTRVILDGDANVAAFAEQKLGVGQKYSVESLCMYTLGTGVGSGIILNGKIWQGMTGMGGEGGHVIVKPEGAPCGCGGHGCLEQYASATAVQRIAMELGLDGQLTAKDLASLAQTGNALALEVFRSVGHSLAIGLTAMINGLNLPLYVLGGGLSESWDLFAPTMFEELKRRSYVYRLTQPENLYPEKLEENRTYILPARLGSDAGLLGAGLLPLAAVALESEPSLP